MKNISRLNIRHGATETIGKIVDLIKDDRLQVRKVTSCVDHVAQNLSRHDEDRRARVD